MSKKRILSVVAVLVVTALAISGCRVRSASEGETKKPTAVVRDSLVGNDGSPSPEAQETLAAQLTLDASASLTIVPTTPVVPTFTDTPTETVPGFPSETPIVVVNLPTTEVPIIGTSTDVLFPTNTPTGFPTDTPSFTPSPTLTWTPTLTPTPTNTETLTPTQTPSSTFTFTPMVTNTFTPFPSLTPVPTIVAIQGTLVPQQMTATEIIAQATQVVLTFWASQGTFVATAFVDPNVVGQTPQPIPPTVTFTPAGQFPDCDYYVQPGDTLGQISRTYNLDTDVVAAANGLTNPNFVKAGYNIKIPGCGRNPTAVPSASPTPTGTLVYENSAGPAQYTVELGDNIYKLSVRFGVTMRELLNANPSVTDMNAIWVGDILTIPTRTQFGTPTPTPQGLPVFPTATPG